MLSDMDLARQQTRYGVRKKILISVEHVFLAQAFERLLNGIIGDVYLAQPAEAIQEVERVSPDLAILEIPLSQLRVLMEGRLMAEGHRNTRVVYLSTDQTPLAAAAAFALGVSAYVLKQSGLDELMKALRIATAGGRYLAKLVSDTEVDVLLNNKRIRKRRLEPLTSRQSEVLRLLMQGLTMQEIADSLKVRIGTVAFHKYGMMERLSVTSNTELIKYGMTHYGAGVVANL